MGVRYVEKPTLLPRFLFWRRLRRGLYFGTMAVILALVVYASFRAPVTLDEVTIPPPEKTGMRKVVLGSGQAAALLKNEPAQRRAEMARIAGARPVCLPEFFVSDFVMPADGRREAVWVWLDKLESCETISREPWGAGRWGARLLRGQDYKVGDRSIAVPWSVVKTLATKQKRNDSDWRFWCRGKDGHIWPMTLYHLEEMKACLG